MFGQVWPEGSMRFRARNADTGGVLATRLGIAATRIARAVGLLNRSGLAPGEGLWIVPSRGVHTCGMRFPIDLVAIDADGYVVDVVTRLRPWRVRLPRRGAAGVIELPPGTLDQCETRIGHRIVFEVHRDAERH